MGCLGIKRTIIKGTGRRADSREMGVHIERKAVRRKGLHFRFQRNLFPRHPSPVREETEMSGDLSGLHQSSEETLRQSSPCCFSPPGFVQNHRHPIHYPGTSVPGTGASGGYHRSTGR